MKKSKINYTIISCFLLLGLLLTGCQSSGSGGEAYELYQEMISAMDGVSSASWDMNAVFGIDLGGTIIDLTMGGTVLEEKTNGKADKIMLDFKLSLADQDMDMKAWYKDGMYYLNTKDQQAKEQQTKRAIDIEEMLGKANIQPLNFPASAIQDSQVKEVAGGKELSFMLKGEALNNLSDQVLSSMGSLMKGLNASSSNPQFSNAECKVVVDAQNIMQSYELSMDLSISSGSKDTVIKCQTMVKLNSINNVMVEYPADLESYIPANQ